MAEHFYTIKDITEITGIPATALRFYDKRGLLTFVRRSANGMRIFTDTDIPKIRTIQFLRNIDMPVNVISRFVGLMQQGDATARERNQMLMTYTKRLEEALSELQEKFEASTCFEKILADHPALDPTCPPPKNLGLPKKLEKFLSRVPV